MLKMPRLPCAIAYLPTNSPLPILDWGNLQFWATFDFSQPQHHTCLLLLCYCCCVTVASYALVLLVILSVASYALVRHV